LNSGNWKGKVKLKKEVVERRSGPEKETIIPTRGATTRSN